MELVDNFIWSCTTEYIAVHVSRILRTFLIVLCCFWQSPSLFELTHPDEQSSRGKWIPQRFSLSCESVSGGLGCVLGVSIARNSS